MTIDYFKDKKNLIIAGIVILIIAVIVLAIFLFRKSGPSNMSIFDLKTFKGQIIDDVIKIPDTTSITNTEGEFVPRGEYNIKIRPQSEREEVYISKAKLTLKMAYDFVTPEVVKWADDQKLVFIKSNGALGLDGRSSSWRLVYTSKQKNMAYEVIISSDKIVSAKEINSVISGFDLPNNWYDSYEAIASLRNLSQFTDDTVSAISFYYSISEKSWAYGLATDNDKKTTSMWVK